VVSIICRRHDESAKKMEVIEGRKINKKDDRK
jgi:hypothetical protein